MKRSTQRMLLAAVTACGFLTSFGFSITAADHVHLLTSIRVLFLIFGPLCVLGVVAVLAGPGGRKTVASRELLGGPGGGAGGSSAGDGRPGDGSPGDGRPGDGSSGDA